MKKGKLMRSAFLMLALVMIMSTLFCGCAEPAPTVVGAELMMGPDQTEYVVGDKFSPDGIMVTEIYSDGTRKNVTDFTWDKTGALTLEDKEVTVKYGTYTFDPIAISVINPGDVKVLQLDNGVDRCELYADGTIQLVGGQRGMPEENCAYWTWDGKTLEIWIPIATGRSTLEEFPTKMDLVYDENNGLSFKYMLKANWQMNYFVNYRTWSKALTADVTYPIA